MYRPCPLFRGALCCPETINKAQQATNNNSSLRPCLGELGARTRVFTSALLCPGAAVKQSAQGHQPRNAIQEPTELPKHSKRCSHAQLMMQQMLVSTIAASFKAICCPCCPPMFLHSPQEALVHPSKTGLFCFVHLRQNFSQLVKSSDTDNYNV